MKRSLIALAIVSTSVFAQTAEPWSSVPGKPAIYDPAKGPLPNDQRYMMTRAGVEAAKYEAMNPVVAQATPVAHRYALPAQAPRTVVNAPEWFVHLPEDTNEMMFAVGTGSSTDEQMAMEKARMAAERRLVEIMYSRVNTQTKSYRSDQGEASIENFEITTRKNARGELIGAQRVDSQITFDGRVYKVYVLLRLPLGERNSLQMQANANRAKREAEIRSGAAFQELDSKTEQDNKEQADADERLRQQVAPKANSNTPQSKVTPVTVPTAEGEVKLMQVDNEEYKKRREEALAKPGAVIGQTVVR